MVQLGPEYEDASNTKKSAHWRISGSCLTTYLIYLTYCRTNAKLPPNHNLVGIPKREQRNELRLFWVAFRTIHILIRGQGLLKHETRCHLQQPWPPSIAKRTGRAKQLSRKVRQRSSKPGELPICHWGNCHLHSACWRENIRIADHVTLCREQQLGCSTAVTLAGCQTMRTRRAALFCANSVSVSTVRHENCEPNSDPSYQRG